VITVPYIPEAPGLSSSRTNNSYCRRRLACYPGSRDRPDVKVIHSLGFSRIVKNAPDTTEVLCSTSLTLTCLILVVTLKMTSSHLVSTSILIRGKNKSKTKERNKGLHNQRISIKHLKIISKMVMLIFKVDAKQLTRVIGILNKIRQDNGIIYMYKYMKNSRLHITRYISGKPLKSITGSGVSVTNY